MQVESPKYKLVFRDQKEVTSPSSNKPAMHHHHSSALPTAEAGARVAAGKVLGVVGREGRRTAE